MKKSTFVLVLLFLAINLASTRGKSYRADIVIYGGTSAAVSAALEAVRSGKSVIIVSPDKHLGGLSSGGLGYTDTGDKTVIGGISKEFYQELFIHYQKPQAWKWEKKEEFGNKGQRTVALDGENASMWIFEPHVAEGIFEKWVKENNITVLKNEWLNRSSKGIKLKNKKIVSFSTLSGKTFKAKMFIDATYEGDLMASAKVSYHVGRESNATYGENYNGNQKTLFHHDHYFKTDISAYQKPGDKSSGLLCEISSEYPGEVGEGDHRLQAYCFRICMSNHPDNRIPFPKPENYNAKRYDLLARVYATGWDETFSKFDMIPNRKTDTNNHGPFSFDYIGKNYDYPEATYERRKEIIKDHENYQKGLLYFLQNDNSIPKAVHEKMSNWGLAKDEFVDNNNWPHQLYIREARRMIGTYVMTERDALGRTQIKRPIGMGSYTLDSHNTQRYVDEKGYVRNEGDIGVKPDRPYSIDYGSIIPKKNEVHNLLVPVCVSSSHIAFGSIRMEPVFMILGHSAAAAASLCIDNNTTVQDLDYEILRTKLLKEKQKLEVN